MAERRQRGEHDAQRNPIKFEPFLQVARTHAGLADLRAQNWILTDIFGDCYVATGTQTHQSILVSKVFAKELSTKCQFFIGPDKEKIVAREPELRNLEVCFSHVYILLPPEADKPRNIVLLAFPVTDVYVGVKPEVYEDFAAQVDAFLPKDEKTKACYFDISEDGKHINIKPPTDANFEYIESKEIYTHSPALYAEADKGFENLYGLEVGGMSSPEWKKFSRPKGMKMR